jgi:cytochrome P450
LKAPTAPAAEPAGVTDLYWDPWERETYAAPYPVYRRLRDEAPLYYNERHSFYLVSRFGDVERMLQDRTTFISGHGDVLEAMQRRAVAPPGLFIWEDPPIHTFHRTRLARVFTKLSVSRLEGDVREFCARTLDALAGRERFDLVAEIAREVPMRVMGLLLGIPESDQVMLRDHILESMHRPPGTDVDRTYVNEAFASYIDWREQHPSDDLMTQLLLTEFEDETGTLRRLGRDELITYINLIASAGNDTTGLLIGWIGKLLSDHPDQRNELAADPALIPNAIEEVLRCEPPPYAFGRTVAAATELHGETLPEGAIVLCVPGAANRDERQFGPDAERFDIHRKAERHVSFGYGIHFCLGANLARLEGRVVLEELLGRMPNWHVDEAGAQLVRGGASRGYEQLPVVVD